MEMGVFSMWPVPRSYLRTTGATLPAESQPVKRRQGGRCEMTASLGVSRLSVES
jgi:hypothetical protein